MKEPLDPRMRETGWRQQLTEAQQAELKRHLAAHPEAAEAWEAERELTRLLEQLPDAPPVSSNFTAQVLAAIQAEARAARRPKTAWFWLWRAWVPKLALASLALAFTFFAIQQHQLKSRELLAQRVATLAQAVPDTDWVKDFNAIRQLPDESPKADTDLLAAMQ